MEKVTIIPSDLLESWEEQAIRENIPYTEFAEFIRMKQRRYEQSLQVQEFLPMLQKTNFPNMAIR